MLNCPNCGYPLDNNHSTFVHCLKCKSVFLEKDLPRSAVITQAFTNIPKRKKFLFSRLWQLRKSQPALLVPLIAVAVILLGSGVFAATYILREKPVDSVRPAGDPQQTSGEEKVDNGSGTASSTAKTSETSSKPKDKNPSTSTSQPASGPAAPTSDVCSIGSPPTSLNYDSFYQKYCSVHSFSVLSASVVSDNALKTAAQIIDRMTSKRPDVLAKLVSKNVRYGVIGKSQQVLDMPEYKDLYDPSYDWNARSRGFGATAYRPLSSSAEENLLCLSGDRYSGESITVHEFSHTFLDMGLETIDGSFRPRIEMAYNGAIGAGKWSNTYASSSVDEYWAEGVQDFFNTNLQASPADGIHNEINTRSELQTYDAVLYSLIAEVFPATDKITCQ